MSSLAAPRQGDNAAGDLIDPTGVGAPGVPTDGVNVDPRFQSPANPISVAGGVRVEF